MSDNIQLNSGSGGSLLAADSVSIGGTTVAVQRVKLGTGADGTYDADVSSANPLPVTFTSGTVSLAPTASTGGLSVSSMISAGSGDATIVKASAGRLYGIVATNINAAARYLKVYNKATAPSASDTPVIRLCLSAGAAGLQAAYSWPNGIEFTAGISFRLVTGIADNDNTGVSASETLVNVFYK